MRAIARIGQRWEDRDGRTWQIANVYRKDGQVALEGPGAQPRYASFGELGRSYLLIEEGS